MSAEDRAHQPTADYEPATVLRYLRFQAKRPGFLIKWPMCAERGRDRMPDIVWPIRRVRLFALLRFVPRLSEIKIQQARKELLSHDGLDG